MKVNVKIKRLNENAVIPKYAHEWDAGFDIVAAEDVIIEPGETEIVPTGLAIALPPGYECQIRPRSGITVKTKLRVQLGTIDAGYNGGIGIIVDNIAQKEINGVDLNANEVLYAETYYLETIDGHFVEDEWLRGYPSGTYLIRKGDRLAQCVINRVEQAKFSIVDELDETSRGAGGFGSSGVTSDTNA